VHDTHFGIEHVLFCTARITIQSEILVWGVSRYLYHATFCIMILVSLHTKSSSMFHAELFYILFPPKWRILTMKTLSYKLRRLSICSFDHRAFSINWKFKCYERRFWLKLNFMSQLRSRRTISLLFCYLTVFSLRLFSIMVKWCYIVQMWCYLKSFPIECKN
jgi:hypothetical protein